MRERQTYPSGRSWLALAVMLVLGPGAACSPPGPNQSLLDVAGEPSEITMQPIGTIHTPYADAAPHQPVPDDTSGSFSLVLEPRYAEGLAELESFRYIYVLFYMDRVSSEPRMTIHPPWAPEGVSVGVFASRAPNRPNRIGLSIVEVLRVEDNVVHTSGLDAFDGTPLLDVKPYIKGLDTRADADLGWVEDLPDAAHLQLHMAGVPHDHDGDGSH